MKKKKEKKTRSQVLTKRTLPGSPPEEEVSRKKRRKKKLTFIFPYKCVCGYEIIYNTDTTPPRSVKCTKCRKKIKRPEDIYE